MSIDYTFGLCVGYVISVDDVKKPFSTKVKEKSHYEMRFNPRTGEQIMDELVIDQEAGEILKWADEELEDLNELCDVLSQTFKGVDVEPSTTYEGWGDSVFFVLNGNDLYTGEDGFEDTHISVGQSMHYAKICSQRTRDRLVVLKEKIEARGIKNIGTAKIFASSSVS